MAVISVYGYRAYVRPSRIYDRVGGVAEPASPNGTVSVKPRDVVVRVFEQIGEQIPLSPADQTMTQARSGDGRIPLRRRDRDFLRHQGDFLHRDVCCLR